jgi:hypothetical protein
MQPKTTLRGEMWDKAVVYFRQAGAKASSHSTYREAVTCFEQAMDMIFWLDQAEAALASLSRCASPS